MSARAMEASSSSKVTVEYHDPSGVFPLVSRDIAARLPLRNLNWQSPSRPLRQIRQLYLEFVPDQETSTALRPPIQRFDSNGPTSFEIVRTTGATARQNTVKERRHQIPGLKTSPYLKIYVLRCDDKDVYKDTERKRIREWIRDNTHSQGKRENHDAYEWLVLHVVVPDTVAASEPRWRESARESDELKERKTKNVKLPGQAPRTVFDRVRADFNESGKGGLDRVAQIRLRKQDVPPDLLPTPALAQTLEETPQERELAWKDLTDKLKILILGPFDTRVRQYEADIAEQELRRTLPGWNFCTFFIHKEGLAKALESIGLVEDALVLYDELSLQLETVVRDLASGRADGTATSFTAFTDDIVDRMLGTTTPDSGSHTVNGTSEDSKRGPLFDKDYREKIVRSDISVFDFFCYLFMRQKALILRLANTRAAKADLGVSYLNDVGEDLVLTSEVCWRASSFVHNSSRALRQDLAVAVAEQKRSLSPADIDALVGAWAYLVADHILAETSAPVLDLAQSNDKKVLPNGSTTPNREEFSFAMGASPYPQRSSSLMIRQSAPDLHRSPSLGIRGSAEVAAGSDVELGAKAVGIPGLPELATYRAELIMLQRKMLEQLAETRGWRAGWAAFKHGRRKSLQEVNLDDGGEFQDVNETLEESPKEASSLLPSVLANDLHSEETFYAAYERLSDGAMRYYALATQTKTVELIIGDLALLKRQRGDIASAEEYIKHLLSNYETDGWSVVEAEMLFLHAECLKKLERNQDYVRTILKLLTKVARKRLSRRRTTSGAAAALDISDETFDVSGLLQAALEVSDGLLEELEYPIDDLFGELEFDDEITTLDDRDGFSINARFRHVLDDTLNINAISARISGAQDASFTVPLVCLQDVAVELGVVELVLSSDTTASGPFVIDCFEFKTHKLRLKKNFQPKRNPVLQLEGNDIISTSVPEEPHIQPFVFLYPPERGFGLDVAVSQEVRIDKPRLLLITLASGWNDVESLEMRVKPTTGGLRLHLADAKFEGIEASKHIPRTNQLSCAHISRERSAVIKLPYTVDQSSPEVSMRFEIRYRTNKGSFTYLSSATLRHELPLDVDVHDRFQMAMLSSSFTLRTTKQARALVVLETELLESEAYAVQAPPISQKYVIISEEIPLSLTYKITRKDCTLDRSRRAKAALALRVRYIAVIEFAVASLLASFVKHLASTEQKGLTRLLLPVFRKRVGEIVRLSRANVEEITTAESMAIPSFDDFEWDDVVSTLPSSLRDAAIACFHEWHAHCEILPIDYAGKLAENVTRSITIVVDVPTVDMVFDASLKLMTEGLYQAPGEPIYKLGQAVRAYVVVRHTKIWGAASVFGEKRVNKDLRFALDVQAEPDAWLIGGPRRKHFNLGEEYVSLDLVLVPLKLGTLSLPIVDVQLAAMEEDADAGRHKMQNQITCETYYESAAETVKVIRNVTVTEVQVRDGAPATVSAGSRPGTATKSTSEPG